MTTTINHLDDTRLHADAMEDATDPDPEVPERARGSRRFPAAYKARILAEYDTLGKADTGALLRRGGFVLVVADRVASTAGPGSRRQDAKLCQ
jgi:hypothetical protein